MTLNVSPGANGIASDPTSAPPSTALAGKNKAGQPGRGSSPEGAEQADGQKLYARQGAKGSTGDARQGPGQLAQAEAFEQEVSQAKTRNERAAAPQGTATGGTASPGDMAEADGSAAAYGQAVHGEPSSEVAEADGAVSAEQAPTPEEEAAIKEFQQKTFASFADDVDAETQKRLSEWLPDFLGGDKETIDKKRLELTKEQADDLAALTDSMGIDASFGSEAILGGAVSVYSAISIDPNSVPVNLEAVQQLQQRFGEHSLKEATPGLAPNASYDTETTLLDTKDKVYEEFVSGLDEATKEQLATWLPDALANRSKLPKDPNDEQGAGLHAIALKHGFGDADALQRSVVEAYDRAVAIETAAELPTVVDLMLVQHDGEYSKDVAFEVNPANDDIAARVEHYEDQGFGDLDAWLPDALAGRGGIPTDDAAAMAKFAEFAEYMGMPGGAEATPEAAFDFIVQSDLFDKALHSGESGDNAYLLFSDRFLDNTIEYGAKHGAVTDDIRADAAGVAEMLLGPDDGSDAARPFDSQALTAAVLHRTGTPLDRPQELQAASGYINKAESLAEQKERLADALVAFHVREEVGTGPMTPRQWAEAFDEISPELVSSLGERAYNNPTSEKMQIITQHLGVPGDHEFMIDEKRTIQISNDELGNVTSFDQDKKKKDKLGMILDIAVPVVATALTFTGWGTAVGVAMNTAYSAYKGAQAIKEGDLLGGALAIAGAVTGGAAGYANVAGSALSGAAGAISTASKVVNIANTSLNAHRSIKDGDYLGALTTGLGGVTAGGGHQGFQTAAKGIDTAQALKEGDLLEAGAGFASLAGDATGFNDGSKDLGFAFEGIEHGLDLADGIQEENYAGIGSAASGLLQTGSDFQEHRKEQAELQAQLQAEQGVGGGIPAFDANGNRIVLQADYHANAAPTDSEQQQKLNDFANIQGAPISQHPPQPGDPTDNPGGQEIILARGPVMQVLGNQEIDVELGVKTPLGGFKVIQEGSRDEGPTHRMEYTAPGGVGKLDSDGNAILEVQAPGPISGKGSLSSDGMGGDVMTGSEIEVPVSPAVDLSLIKEQTVKSDGEINERAGIGVEVGKGNLSLHGAIYMKDRHQPEITAQDDPSGSGRTYESSEMFLRHEQPIQHEKDAEELSKRLERERLEREEMRKQDQPLR